MKGSKYTDAQREQAFALLAKGMNVTAVGKQLNIPKQTISDWKNREAEDDEDFRAKRSEEKRKVVSSAWKIVQTSMRAIEKQVGATLKENSDIDKVILKIMQCPNIDEPTADKITEIVRNYTGVGMGELTKTMAGVYAQQQKLELDLNGGENGGVLEIGFAEGEEFAQ